MKILCNSADIDVNMARPCQNYLLRPIIASKCEIVVCALISSGCGGEGGKGGCSEGLRLMIEAHNTTQAVSSLRL
jgi:hypothetical protein